MGFKTVGQLPEFYLELTIAVVEVLCRQKMDKSTAVAVGLEITKHLSKKFGGLQFYIPKNVVAETAKKAVKIYNEFNGSNYRELAEKHGFTEVWVRELVKRGKKTATNLDR